MTPAGSLLLCLAYTIGLLATAISPKIAGLPMGGVGLLLLGIVLPHTIPQLRKTGLPSRLWLLAGVVGLLATLYLAVRTPQPGPNDISRLILPVNHDLEQQLVAVEGRIISTPRLTRSQKSQFWLRVTQLHELSAEGQSQLGTKVNGKLYVTAPLLQTTGLQPGQTIEVTGQLYRPKAATNPGGFDFQAYLAREGGFAGLRGKQIKIQEIDQPSLLTGWAIQRRIIRAQVAWLGSPVGPLVSSMVLGNRVVDLSYDIRDQFTQAGLAHALAASGFQVSLILSILLTLTSKFSKKIQFCVGTSAIVVFLCLTGLQPSILRASIMGVSTLLALTIGRKIKPLGSLVTAATLLLLFNPVWIWDLGFQFSFLATLGLLVTVPTLTKCLDWLPPVITALIAVPIAAYLWTAPLQLYAFGMVSPYAIPINILTTPLIALISLGGVISAACAVIWPLSGSAIAWLLYYPTYGLIELVNISQRLPGVSISAGTITVFQLLVIYGLILLVWFNQSWQKRWWVVGALSISLVVWPAVWHHQHVQQVTVLTASNQPVLLIQDKTRKILLSKSDEATTRLTVNAFLQKEGINYLDEAVVLGTDQKAIEGWQAILQQLTVRQLWVNSNLSKSQEETSPTELVKLQTSGPFEKTLLQQLSIGQTYGSSSIALKRLNSVPPILEWSFAGQTWIYVSVERGLSTKLASIPARNSSVDVLWWAGDRFRVDLLEKLHPRVAIASANSVNPEIVGYCQKHQIQLYWTGRDGALQWTPQQGFQKLLNSDLDVLS